MSNTKTVMSQAANTQGIPLDITDVFSTYLYDGTNVAQTITNGIDLAGEGGLVWQKLRAHPTPPDGQDHYLRDTERGVGKRLRSNSTAGETNDGGITSVNSDGFALSGGTAGNLNGATYASWTFRKAPKFFDVVTYTGDGTSNRQIAHNINGTVGTILIKRLDNGNWLAWHRSVNPGYGIFDLTSAFTSGANGFFNAVTDTYLETSWLNTSGVNYVVYLFAHNDSGDGEFGPDADQDIIKCGSYTGNGSATGPVIDLGFEPQWLMIKSASSTYNWIILDTMRGFSAAPSANTLFANTSNAEDPAGTRAQPTSTGFEIITSSFDYNKSGDDFIYMAIRRGPLAPPEAATEVFAMDMDGATNNHLTSGFPVDLGVYKSKLNTYNWSFNDRLRGARSLKSNTNAAESGNTLAVFDNNTGWADSAGLTSEYPSWMWKRAPSFFDVVAYTGDGTTARSIPHNLGVAPEMMFHKRRNNTNDWYVPDFQNSQLLVLNGNYSAFDTSILANYYGSGNGSSGGAGSLVTPDASTFTVTPNANVNGSGDTYIAYLFATLAGVSKVGSYTGNGTSQTIDCGFTSGARFVLVKMTSGTGDWWIFDTSRGLGKNLRLNTTAAESSNTGMYGNSSGFLVLENNPMYLNSTGATYIFYAIA